MPVADSGPPRRLRRIRHGIADVLGGAVTAVPGRTGSILRVTYFRARGAQIGQRVRIDSFVQIDAPDRVRIGDDTWIDRSAILIAGEARPGRETRSVGDADRVAAGRIEIGRRCHVGPFTILSGMGGLSLADDVTLSAGTKAYSLSHHFRSWSRPDDDSVVFGSMGPDANQSMLQGPVVLERSVGVGADVLILPGTTIGERSFVRPRAVVRGSWPARSLLGGDPAVREGDRYGVAIAADDA